MKIDEGKTLTIVKAVSECPDNYTIGDQFVAVKKGWCFVWLYVYCVSRVDTSGRIIFVQGLPHIPKSLTTTVHYAGVGESVERLLYRIESNGNLELSGGANGRFYSILLSYPIEG